MSNVGFFLRWLRRGRVYALFLATFLYATGFVGDLPLPKTINSGASGPLAWAVVTDVLLLGLFAVQHSVMARPAFKRWWTRFVPQPIERATYVLFASLALDLLYWQWVPIAGSAWHVSNRRVCWRCGRLLVRLGAGFLSTCLLSHFELFGLQQVLCRLRGSPVPAAVFKTPALYKLIRSSHLFGLSDRLLGDAGMSYGHLLFALATTGYILIGIQFEERDLIALFGDQVPGLSPGCRMLLPLPSHRTEAVPVKPPEPAR